MPRSPRRGGRETAARPTAASFSSIPLEDRLALRAGGFFPLLRHLRADLLERRLHLGVGLAHGHAVLGEGLVAFLLACLRHFPAALLGGGGGLGERRLLVLGQAREAALVH